MWRFPHLHAITISDKYMYCRDTSRKCLSCDSLEGTKLSNTMQHVLKPPKACVWIIMHCLLLSCLLRALECETGARTVDPDIQKDLPYWTLIEIMVVSWNSVVKRLIIDGLLQLKLYLHSSMIALDMTCACVEHFWRFHYICPCHPLSQCFHPTTMRWGMSGTHGRTRPQSNEPQLRVERRDRMQLETMTFWFEMFIFWAIRRWQCATCPVWRINGWSEALWTLQEVTRT